MNTCIYLPYFITGRPAHSAAMPVLFLLSWSKKWVPNFTFIGAKCGNTAPKTVKISIFGHKFVPQGPIFAATFLKL